MSDSTLENLFQWIKEHDETLPKEIKEGEHTAPMTPKELISVYGPKFLAERAALKAELEEVERLRLVLGEATRDAYIAQKALEEKHDRPSLWDLAYCFLFGHTPERLIHSRHLICKRCTMIVEGKRV